MRMGTRQKESHPTDHHHSQYRPGSAMVREVLVEYCFPPLTANTGPVACIVRAVFASGEMCVC